MLKLTSTAHMVMTLVYLVKDGNILLHERLSNREMIPNEWLGLGGKVEPGESPDACAIREVQEEIGVTLSSVVYQGNFTYVGSDGRPGTIHLFVATNWTGDVPKATVDGERLEWFPIDGVEGLNGLSDLQQLFLPTILKGDLYAELAVYKDKKLVTYADSKEYFESRTH